MDGSDMGESPMLPAESYLGARRLYGTIPVEANADLRQQRGVIHRIEHATRETGNGTEMSLSVNSQQVA